MSQLVARLAKPFSFPAYGRHTHPGDEMPVFDVDTAVFCLVTAISTVVLLAL